MSKELEKYIRDNLGKFEEIEQPDVEQFWEEFQKKKPAPKLLLVYKKCAAAAAILLIIGLSTYVFSLNQSINKWELVENLEQIDPQLATYQMTLITILASQDSLVKSMQVNPDQYQDIYQQIEELEKLTKLYKEDLSKHGPDRKIIKALLKCAKQKVRLYELLLFEIELDEHSKNLNDEKHI